MPRYAAFLRAVNLGKSRRVSGAELKAIFEGAGAEEATAFRTSGNVAFTGEGKAAELTGAIERALEGELGYAVPVFLRTEAEMRAMSGHEPFDPELVEGSKGKLQVVLLGEKPGKRAREQVLALGTGEDRLAFGDRELYWLPEGGTQGSALDFKPIGDLLGVSTTRTKGTIEQMAAKFFPRPA